MKKNNLRIFYTLAMFGLLDDVFTNDDNYSNNLIEIVNFLLITLRTPTVPLVTNILITDDMAL